MVTSADAVGDGLVASLALPGGNVTGMTLFSRELSGERLENVKETIPRISRVAVLFNSLQFLEPTAGQRDGDGGGAARLKTVPLSIRFPDGVEPAFAEAARNGAGVVVVVSDSAPITDRTHLGAAGLKCRLPTMLTNNASAQRQLHLRTSDNYT